MRTLYLQIDDVKAELARIPERPERMQDFKDSQKSEKMSCLPMGCGDTQEKERV